MNRGFSHRLVWLGLTVVLVGVLAGAVLARPIGGQADYQLVRWTTAGFLAVKAAQTVRAFFPTLLREVEP